MDRWLIKLPPKPKETIIAKENDKMEKEPIDIIAKDTISKDTITKDTLDDNEDVVEILNVTLTSKKRLGDDQEEEGSKRDDNPHPPKTLKTETDFPSLVGSSSSSTPAIAPKTAPKTSPTTAVKTAVKPKETTKETSKAKQLAPSASPLFSKVRNVPIADAEYQDTCLRFATLNDGRELLIGENVIALPHGCSPSNPKGIKDAVIGARVGGDLFVPLPGLDLLVVVPERRFGDKEGRPTLKLKTLPDCAEVTSISLSGVASGCMGYEEDGDVRHLDSYPFGEGAASLLIATRRWLWLYTVRKESTTSSFSTTLESMLDISSPSPLSSSLSSHGMSKALLYVDPTGERFALLSSRGAVFVAPFEGTKAGTAPVRVLELHEPMRRSDKDAWVGGMCLFRPSEGGGCQLVTVGSEGNISVTALDDGAARVGRSYQYSADDAWHATARGSGCSVQYAYAPAFHVAVSNKYGVALTGSRESVVHLWDLRSKKSSPAGKLLSTSPRLASGTASKINLMCVAASESGLFGYSNSNNDDDATLKVIVPVGAAGKE